MFCLDCRRRVNGGLCVYVSNAYESCLYKFDSTCTSRLPPDIKLIWIHITSRFSSDVEHVVGLCYHPPKPIYQSTLFIDTIKHDIDVIANQNPNDVIIFAGDLNQLNVTWLTQECGMTMINQPTNQPINRRMAPKFSTIFLPAQCIHNRGTCYSNMAGWLLSHAGIVSKRGTINTRGVGKIGVFRRKSPFISEMVRDRPMVTMMVNRKSWVPDRLVSFLMTLSDP